MILRIRITTHVAIARINAISKTIAILMKIMVNSYDSECMVMLVHQYRVFSPELQSGNRTRFRKVDRIIRISAEAGLSLPRLKYPDAFLSSPGRAFPTPPAHSIPRAF